MEASAIFYFLTHTGMMPCIVDASAFDKKPDKYLTVNSQGKDITGLVMGDLELLDVDIPRIYSELQS